MKTYKHSSEVYAGGYGIPLYDIRADIWTVRLGAEEFEVSSTARTQEVTLNGRRIKVIAKQDILNNQIK
jgi:hypothetical protein